MFPIRISLDRAAAAKVVDQLAFWKRAYPAAVAGGLYEEGQEFAAIAAERAPKQTGTLRESVFVSRPDETAKRPTVEVGFGAEYAGIVHARARLASGVPHWLAETMHDRIPGLADRVLRAAKRLASSRGGVDDVDSRFPERPQAGTRRRGTPTSSSRGRARRP